MIERCADGEVGCVLVTFTICSDGHELPVRLVGAFNDWDGDGLVLEPTVEAQLAATVSLPTGRRFASATAMPGAGGSTTGPPTATAPTSGAA